MAGGGGRGDGGRRRRCVCVCGVGGGVVCGVWCVTWRGVAWHAVVWWREREEGRGKNFQRNKCTSQNAYFFRNFGLSHFCTVFSTICGTVVEENEKHNGSKLGFWDSSAHF